MKRRDLEKMSIGELVQLFHDTRRLILSKDTNENTKVRLNKELILINQIIANKKRGLGEGKG